MVIEHAAHAAPGLVAEVRRGTLGDREVRLSRPTAPGLGAFRHCRAGDARPTWSPARQVWTVPAGAWPCVQRLLVGAGFEISEAAQPSTAIAGFRRAQQRVQRSRDDARWTAGVEALPGRDDSEVTR